MESEKLALNEKDLQVISVEFAMKNWLSTWRSLNEDFLQLQTTAMEFDQFIKLATTKIEHYQNILKEPKSDDIKSFKNVANSGDVDLELVQVLDKVIDLKDEIFSTNKMLQDHKLQLQNVQKKLLPIAAKSQLASRSLAESKVIYGNLKKRNLLLQAVKNEAMELYRSRDQMFDYQLIEKALELLNAQNKAKALASASNNLQTNIDQIQLRERTLLMHLAAGNVERNKKTKYLHNIQKYLRFLWECVSSLALCPKLREPCNKFHCALVLL